MVSMLDRATRVLLAACATLCLIGSATAQAGRVVLAGKDWRPDAELAQAMRPIERREPLLVVLHREEDPRVALAGWRIATRDLTPVAGTDGANSVDALDATAERALASEVLAADAIALHGGEWIDWWRCLSPDKRPSRILVALREAHARGATVLAFDRAATFVAGGLVLPEEVGREPKNTAARGRAWIVAGNVGDEALLVECEGDRGRGAGGVLDAVSRELRLAGGFEAQGAWVLARDGALVVDFERRRIAPLARAALRLCFERARKSATKSLAEVECTLHVARAEPRSWWRARVHPAWSAMAASRRIDLPCSMAAGTPDEERAATRALDLATIFATLERGAAAEHSDAAGTLHILPSGVDEQGARRALARWTRRVED